MALAITNKSDFQNISVLKKSHHKNVFRANVVKNISDPEKEQAVQPEGATRVVDTELLH